MSAPYDWCDPRCPNPCSCQEESQRQIEAMTQAQRDSLGITWKPSQVAQSGKPDVRAEQR